MKVIKRDFGMYRLRTDCEDDLWALARLCVKGRSIGMLGERRDQTTAGQEGGRAKAAERKKMWIRLAIESNEFQTFADTLRVHGIIEDAQFDQGSHHTHIVQVRDEIEISSNHEFPLVDQELIKQACANSGKAKVVILVVETDEAIMFEVTSRGLREVSTWTMRGGGKYTGSKISEGVSKSFFEKIARESNDSVPKDTPIVICGPGHARELLAPLIDGSTKLVATSMGGRGAANEVISDGLAGDILSEHAVVIETAMLDEAWKRISTNGAVAYGREMIEKSLNEGAIETLLVSADLLRESDWEEIVGNLSDIGAKLVQCSTDHDAGQQLLGMGGAVALLRFKV
ncbi:MAG: pelota family protein [Euryarchaeota archaeon]|nr:pelota family protein [Euryarchaeota archaeon]